MSKENSISLKTAILININIMLGTGIFANTVVLAKFSEALSVLSYIIICVLMLPLVLSIAKLSEIYPDGGFYAYCKNEISTFAGFFASWAYLTGKLASGAFMAHVSLALLQKLIPALGNINLFLIEVVVISIFIMLNMLNIKTSGKIQTGFTILKLIPIIFAIFFGLFLFDPSNFASANRIWEGIPTSLPILFYAAMGVEAACLLSSKIENPSKNAPKAILFSYFIAISVMTVYQFVVYGALGRILSSITQTPEYLQTFPVFLQKLIPAMPTVGLYITAILHIAIAASALGGSYGIMFSNTWNLHTLAKNNHTFFSKFFASLNRHAIPYACVGFIGIMYLVYLFISGGDQMLLQPTAVLGTILAFSLSVAALIITKIRRPETKIMLLIPVFGAIVCAVMAHRCINMLISGGLSSMLILFLIMIGIGIVMYGIKNKAKKIQTN